MKNKGIENIEINKMDLFLSKDVSFSWSDKINGGSGEKNIEMPFTILSAKPKAPIWLVVRKMFSINGQDKLIPDPKAPFIKM